MARLLGVGEGHLEARHQVSGGDELHAERADELPKADVHPPQGGDDGVGGVLGGHPASPREDLGQGGRMAETLRPGFEPGSNGL